MSSFNAVLFEKSGIDPEKQGSQDSIVMAGPQAETHLPVYSVLTGGILGSHSLRNLALVLENTIVSFGSDRWKSRLALPVHGFPDMLRYSSAVFLLKSGIVPNKK
jgi:hypothetical protein